eukprot:3108935-Rhodomonas_salina.1
MRMHWCLLLQPAQHWHVSEDGGAIKVGCFRDEVSEILENLQKQLRAVTVDANTLHTRTDLGTIAKDAGPSEKLHRDARKHSSRWTNCAEVPLSTELNVLKDQQLACCLAHHNFVTKPPQDWFLPNMLITESHRERLMDKARPTNSWTVRSCNQSSGEARSSSSQSRSLCSHGSKLHRDCKRTMFGGYTSCWTSTTTSLLPWKTSDSALPWWSRSTRPCSTSGVELLLS